MPLPFEGDPALLGRLLAGVSEVDQQPQYVPAASCGAACGSRPSKLRCHPRTTHAVRQRRNLAKELPRHRGLGPGRADEVR